MVILVTPDEFGAGLRGCAARPLEAKNIEARPVLKPMHLQPLFEVEASKARDAGKARKGWGKYRARVAGGEVAEDLFDQGLCLPFGRAMTNADLDRIISVIRKCRK
jgi:dTDP-4-amino-4,6-dideoxygalactose transaminase